MIFNTYFDFLVRRAVKEDAGFKMGSSGVAHHEHTDDLSLVSATFEELDRQLQRLVTECAILGLTLSVRLRL